MVQVSRVYINRQKNNVLSAGEGKKSKKMSFVLLRLIAVIVNNHTVLPVF